MNIKIKKLNQEAVIPAYAKSEDAGMDLTAISLKRTHEYVELGTGLAIEIPSGYMGLVFPRSSISNTINYMANSVGVIDSGYAGEIKIRFKSEYKNEWDYHLADYSIGDRVAQLIILPFPKIEFEEVEELSKTERGEGGFGSTNKG